MFVYYKTMSRNLKNMLLLSNVDIGE